MVLRTALLAETGKLDPRDSAAAGRLESAADGAGLATLTLIWLATLTLDWLATWIAAVGERRTADGMRDSRASELTEIPPNSHTISAGYGGITSGNFFAAGHTNRNKKKNFNKTNKQNEVKGHRLLSV